MPGEQQRIRILHISDLHARGSRDQRRAWKRTQVLGDAWRRNLDELTADGLGFELVAFTGDVADWGLPEDYAEAAPFVDELLTHLKVPRERFFAVPGNHDIQRKLRKAAWRTMRKGMWSARQQVGEWLADAGKVPFGFQPKWRDAVLDREQAFWNWIERDLGRSDLLPKNSPHGRLGYRVSISVGRQTVHIIGLDSAWLAGDDSDAGKLWLTEDQLGRLCRDDRGQSLPGFRLALVHHPLSDLADADIAQRHLADTVDLMLRGHQHTPLARTEYQPDRSFRELAAGCLYEGDQSNQYPNACQVIDAVLGSDGHPLQYEVRFRAWSATGHWHDNSALYREARNGRLTWDVVRSEFPPSFPSPQPSPPLQSPPPARARPWRVSDLPPQYETGQEASDAVVHTLPHGRSPEPVPLPSVLRMPMPQNPLFVGRADELRLLAEALQVGNTAAIGQVASVTGLGGMGKTQLAAEFVHRYGKFFTGGVFWLGFSEPASVLGQFLQCGGPAHLGLWSSEAAPNIDTQVAMVRTAFAAPVPRLLVFDNCEDEKLLAEWRPVTGGCRVLVTCRRHAFSPHLGVYTLALDVLPRAESLALLRSLDRGHLFEAADGAMLDAICAELGDLPLALHLAGSFLARYHAVVSPAAYLAQLRSPALLEHPSLQGRGAENSPTNHELHVGKTFALSWDRLDPANRVDAMARDLLQRAACLAPGEPIPGVLLVATLGLPEEDLDATLAQADALHRLLALGLLDAPEPGTYRIHRLVMAFVRQTDGDHTAARTAVEHVLLHEAEQVNESGNPARLLPWQPHLRAVTDAALAREDVHAVRLCTALGWHLRMIAKYRDARPYLERALVIREQQLGPEDLNTAQSSNLLALLLQDEGAYAEARPLFERAFSIAKQKLGPEHRNSVTSLSNQALLLKAQGAYDEARPLLEQALAIYERQLGPEHLDTATALSNLAGLLHTMGAAAEARPLFERALAIHEKQLGAQHPATARSLDNLAAVLQGQGEHTQARALHERALAIREQQLGPEHPETATSLNNLAGLAHAQRAYAEARPLLERALAIREKLSGPEHPDTAQLVHNLAALLQAQGAYAEARPLFERVFAIHEKLLGPEHKETIKSLHYVAALLLDQGAHAEARPLFERVLAIREKQLGPEHKETIKSLHYLAAVLHAQGAHVEARPLFERALAAYEKQLGPDHPDTAACLNDLATVLHAQGAYAEAQPLFERALAVCEKQLGPDHPDTAKSLNNLAALLHAQGAQAEARPLLERALAIHEKQVGADPLDTAQSLNNLAALLVAQGAHAEARPLLERALAICEKQLGLAHPETLRNLEQLAALLSAQGAHAEARALFERALTICGTLLGPDHPSTAVSQYNLGRLLQDQGAHAEARVLYERALATFEAKLRPDHPFTWAVRDNLQNLPGS